MLLYQSSQSHLNSPHSKQFINLITSEKQKVGRGLQSCTSDISVIEATIRGQPVVVIDTPGIDDTRKGMKEADILVAIAIRLEAMCVTLCLTLVPANLN